MARRIHKVALCIDCNDEAVDPTSLEPGEQWRARCSWCLDMRRDPHYARRCIDFGYGVAESICQDLLRIEAYGCDMNQDRPWALAETLVSRYVAGHGLGTDIEDLLSEAFSPLTNRTPTFWERVMLVDPRWPEMDRKMAAARDAQKLIKARREVILALEEMFQSAAGLRRKQLEALLQELDLKEQIAQKLLLANSRLETIQALEMSQRPKLLPESTESNSKTHEVVREHREELQARTAARRTALADFRGEIRDVMRRDDLDDSEKAFEVRTVLETFRLAEDALPKRVREFLASADEAEEEGEV